MINEILAFLQTFYTKPLLFEAPRTIRIPEHRVAIKLLSLTDDTVTAPAITRRSAQDAFLSALSKGDRLIQIFEDRWVFQRPLVENMLRYRLGVRARVVRASKCKVREVTKEDAIAFFKRNHLDGWVKARFTLGLYLGEELLTAVSFRKPGTPNRVGMIEIARFASEQGLTVHGGLSKLLRAVKATHHLTGFSAILTYSDNTWGSGRAYSETGFKFDGYTFPTKDYTDGVRRIPRTTCKKRPSIIPGDTEIAQQARLGRVMIPGPGNSAWVMPLQNTACFS